MHRIWGLSLVSCLAFGLTFASVRADDTQNKAAPKGAGKSPNAGKNKGVDVGQIVQQGTGLSKQEVERLEANLKAEPENLADRTRLLATTSGRSASWALMLQSSRRRHILWMIRNHPEAEIAGLSEMTIDPSGHAAADAEGYAEAKEAWLQQVETHKTSRW